MRLHHCMALHETNAAACGSASQGMAAPMTGPKRTRMHIPGPGRDAVFLMPSEQKPPQTPRRLDYSATPFSVTAAVYQVVLCARKPCWLPKPKNHPKQVSHGTDGQLF